MDLCVASHRAILKALQAFEDGELSLSIDGLVTIATTEGNVRFLDGVCFAAPSAAWVGADLVGWLEELPHLSGVGAWWRPGLRAVMRTKDGRFALAAPSQDLILDATPASSGVATHSARFLVARGEATPPETQTRTIPRPAESGVGLRERGTWHRTALMPWTLGEGHRVTRGAREPFGPLPPVVNPPPKPPVYISVSACAQTLPPVVPPPRRQTSTDDHLPRVA